MHSEHAGHLLQYEGLAVGSHLPISIHNTVVGYADDLPAPPAQHEQNINNPVSHQNKVI